MKKADLVEKLAKQEKISKAAAGRLYDTVFASVKEELLAGENVTIQGFGTFKVKQREARKGRNPITGEAIDIAAQKVVRFSASTTLKSEINK